MKAFNSILKGFQKAIQQLEDLADAKIEQAETLDEQAKGLRDEAKVAEQAAVNIRGLVGDKV